MNSVNAYVDEGIDYDGDPVGPSLSIYRGNPSVRRSVRPSGGHACPACQKTKEINIFKYISVRGGKLGSQDASLHLYKTVYPSIALVCKSTDLSVIVSQ